MTRNKSIAKSKIKLGHPINSVKELSADNSRIIFTFYNVDRDGDFAFNPARKDFDSKLFVEKLISYSSMTWREILKQTHDDGKSKHHNLSAKSLSKKALERINKKGFTYLEGLFSIALNNKTRIIGFRDGAEFQVVCYDAAHEFSVSLKRNT